RFEVLKGEATRRRQLDPSYQLPGHAHHGAPGVHGAHGVTPSKGYYATTGMSLRSDGRAESEDITLSARNALINMIDYIADAYSFTREQAYCLASVAVDLRVQPGLVPAERRRRPAHQPGGRRPEHDGIGRPAARYLRLSRGPLALV